MCFLEKLIKISFRKHVTVVSYRYRYRKLNKNTDVGAVKHDFFPTVYQK